MDDPIIVYLKNKAAEFDTEQSRESDNLCGFYEDVQNENLAFLFGVLHTKLNWLFDFLNTKLSNQHYNAHESRELLYCIDEIKKLHINLKDTEYEFQIEKTYNSNMEACLNFLVHSGGSPIPEDFKRISIIEAKPIFTLISSASISTGTYKIPFTLTQIGEGSYSIVFKYKDKFYNKFFAVKKAKPDLNEKEIKRFKKEFEVMKQLNSPYVLEVYDFDDSSNQYVMEYADYTLENFINKNNNKLKFTERFNLARQVFKAFDYVTGKDVLHRDISTKNVLIKNYDNLLVVKISDFGLVKDKTSNITSRNTEFKGSLNDPKLELHGFKIMKFAMKLLPLLV